jgi:hypothetical protein
VILIVHCNVCGDVRDAHVVIVELEAGDDVVQKVISPVRTTLPNCTNPTTSSITASNAPPEAEVKVTGAYACFLPKHTTTYGRMCGEKLVLSDEQRTLVMNHARTELYKLYPHLDQPPDSIISSGGGGDNSRVVEEALEMGHTGGRRLSSVSHKYSTAAEVQINAACEGYEDMYTCGPDISFSGLAGDMQAGWVVANSILGFKRGDVFNGKNVMMEI